ncbi:hypothetical protein A2U01_0063177, partial [Trifolium medium]|nr:hypothetical protein [Trifolium medium]
SPDSTIKQVVSELSHQFQNQDADKSSPEKEAKEDKEEEKELKQVSPPRIEVNDSSPLKETQAIETPPAQASKEEHALPTPQGSPHFESTPTAVLVPEQVIVQEPPVKELEPQ